jgi:hypothetical protein
MPDAASPVEKPLNPFAENFWRRPAAEFYVLDGLHCRGLSLNGVGPRHRGCHLIWHQDWLELYA